MKVNKILLYIFFFLCPVMTFAQDTDTSDNVSHTVTVNITTADSIFYKKRVFDSNFEEKYTDTYFVYENKAKGTSLWENFKAWLYEMFNEIFSFGNKTQETSWFAIMIRVIAGLIILFVVYLIVKAILNKEGIWIFSKSRKNISIQQITAEDIKHTDFSILVEETIKAGDFRLAVRYYYLWLLKKLTIREIIDWHWDKTNTDYLYEIKNEVLRKEFEYLSYVYDYSWYGEFTIDEVAFKKAEQAFKKTLNTL